MSGSAAHETGRREAPAVGLDADRAQVLVLLRWRLGVAAAANDARAGKLLGKVARLA